MLLKLYCAYRSPGGLVKTQIPGQAPRDSDSVGLEWEDMHFSKANAASIALSSSDIDYISFILICV